MVPSSSRVAQLKFSASARTFGLKVILRFWFCRSKDQKNLKEAGSVGYCASKDNYYSGFTGNLFITGLGCIKDFALTPANIDERIVLLEMNQEIGRLLLADKGLISPELKDLVRTCGINLQTPLRRNMKNDRSLSFGHKIISKRRLVGTVIGLLFDRFMIKAQDLWHLVSKIGRKVLAHTVILVLNLPLTPENPLQCEAFFI